jgi:hypothetical protein
MKNNFWGSRFVKESDNLSQKTSVHFDFEQKIVVGVRGRRKMRYKLLRKRTGLRVSELSLGTGWGLGADPTEARQMVDRFLKLANGVESGRRACA